MGKLGKGVRITSRKAVHNKQTQHNQSIASDNKRQTVLESSLQHSFGLTIRCRPQRQRTMPDSSTLPLDRDTPDQVRPHMSPSDIGN